MMSALLRGNGLVKNIIFDAASSNNRDNCFDPYVLLKKTFKSAGIQIDTSDMGVTKTPFFELHQDVQFETCVDRNYLLMFETEFVKPENKNLKEQARYRKIFTWNDSLVDGEYFVKLNFPNPVAAHEPDGFRARDRFCCLIASNRTLSSKDERILYPKRVEAIRWFEKNAPQDFDLFGVDWEMPVLHSGFVGRLERKLWPAISSLKKPTPFCSYRGKLKHKRDALCRTRFSICYENVADLPGYITEKIFDCFFSGCVPVYWGASNITTYIPPDCFIDRRAFRDMTSVYDYLKKITEEQFIGYQTSIAKFLRSGAAGPFTAEFFAETVVTTIVRDLELGA